MTGVTATLATLATTLKGLGVLSFTLDCPAMPGEGGPSRPASFTITTDTDMPVHCGRGKVKFRGYVSANFEHNGLNAILTPLGDLICNVGRAGAVLTNAFADRRAADRRAESAERRLADTLDGGIAIQGPYLVQVAADGAAWLQDPVKRDAGMGLRYPDLATLWRAHPNLRPVCWSDGDLICEPFALQAGNPEGDTP